jgi:cytochrome c peroxidase
MRTLAALSLLFAACNYVGPLTPFPTEPPIIDDFPVDPQPVPHPNFGTTKQALEPPPPISGGTLTILAGDAIAVASDPDRDHLYVIDLQKKILISDIALQKGDEPGRVIEDAEHRVHVVLRGAGAVLTLSEPWTTPMRRPVCATPRGIAAEGTKLLIACASGELLTLAQRDGGIIQTRALPDDLRDVAVLPDGRVLITRLRSAELLFIGTDDTLETRKSSSPNSTRSAFGAMRIASSGAKTFVLHQLGTDAPVEAQQAGGYGGSDPCSGPIVQTTVTDATSTAQQQFPSILNAVVPVDLAVHASTLAVVAPGNAFTPQMGTVFLFDSSTTGTCAQAQQLITDVGQPIAAAFNSTGDLYVQTREPAELYRLSSREAAPTRALVLSTVSRADTGHAVFHSNAGGSVACASCHLEGGDDARVWTFTGIGPRRTQNLRGGVKGTEPFHWDGDQADFSALTHEVFERRMTGPSLSNAEVAATARFVNEIAPHKARTSVDTAAAARGKSLFEGSAECSSCHSGSALTNNATVDVGTGGRFQVPSLRGVSWRAPFMHDGSVSTLRERFSELGGGDKHGTTSQLSAFEIDDLVAYMETL